MYELSGMHVAWCVRPLKRRTCLLQASKVLRSAMLIPVLIEQLLKVLHLSLEVWSCEASLHVPQSRVANAMSSRGLVLSLDTTSSN